ncbi:MAG: class I SAM-dependent methyltransferase [Bacteriovoracaceae bacterium]|nr:class I SAM-dependent methyltransferase [Bacteriovoracaceae bacterium]
MTENTMLLNRLTKNLQRLKGWLKQNQITCYRLYEKDIPDYPYLIDIYHDEAVIYEKGKTLDEETEYLRDNSTELISSALQQLLNITPDKQHFKTRSVQKENAQYNKLKNAKQEKIISEHGIKYYVNLVDYLDTGLFLDHRPLRKIVLNSSEGKDVLNLFSYTCSLSLAAAVGKAKSVTSVDLSNQYLNWGKRNFELNGLNLSKYDFLQSDILGFLPHHQKTYDLIILDPPSFSNSKKMTTHLDILEDHHNLVGICLKLLNYGGTLYFSTNKRGFKLDPSFKYAEDISERTIPMDFRDMKIHKCFKFEKR